MLSVLSTIHVHHVPLPDSWCDMKALQKMVSIWKAVRLTSGFWESTLATFKSISGDELTCVNSSSTIAKAFCTGSPLMRVASFLTSVEIKPFEHSSTATEFLIGVCVRSRNRAIKHSANTTGICFGVVPSPTVESVKTQDLSDGHGKVYWTKYLVLLTKSYRQLVLPFWCCVSWFLWPFKCIIST